ncbi:MAG TPA: STAS domain-containing protein [Solirubrobacterales bacterium]|nr:STAS domain-containing protein [Solirubrobacterales bacterium]
MGLDAENPPRLEITRRVDDGVGEIALQGELDLATAGDLEAAFSQVVAERPRAVLLDLSALEFMDSTGIKTLLQLERRCGKSDVRFALTEGSGAVSRLFALTQLDRHFEVFGSRDAARSALA